MSGHISITVEVDQNQAEKYLLWLVSQYEAAMAECWYDDRYRYTPQGLRGKRILEDRPHCRHLPDDPRTAQADSGRA